MHTTDSTTKTIKIELQPHVVYTIHIILGIYNNGHVLYTISCQHTQNYGLQLKDESERDDPCYNLYHHFIVYIAVETIN